ncbi:MAG TPA: hypothetical protein VHB69_10850 [Mycobacteriales bacterium]|nr:hypothetical protein [Mycobacteriales bacterium]
MTAARAARPRWLAPVVTAAVLAVGYALVAPHTADLAAQTARADVFHRSGYIAYWTGWYGGTPTAGYSLVTPPLLAIFGPVALGALSIIAAGVIAVPLLRQTRRPRAGAIAVAVSGTLDVLSGRITFATGVVVALLALLAIERRRPWLAFVVAVLTTATSPVAGVLLAVAAGATVLAGPRRRRGGAAAVLGVALSLVMIAILTSGSRGGYEPFTFTSLVMSWGTTVLVMLSPVGRRMRVVGWLTLWLLLGCYLIHSPLGANATRIAVLGAAPALVAVARWPRPVLVPVVVVASLLPAAQLLNDMEVANGPAATKAFVAPLQAELAEQPDLRQYRVEVLATKTLWPETYLLPEVSLARGWERQTDEARDPEFYGRRPLTASEYREFLDRYAVGFVAVPVGVRLDYGSTREAALIRAGLPYLSEIWRNPDWELYSVESPTQLASAPATVVSQEDTGMTVRVPAAGHYLLRLIWSPYFVVSGATLARGTGNGVILEAPSAGVYRVHAEWRWP